MATKLKDMIQRDYDTPYYELSLSWDDDGDAEFEMDMVDSTSKLGLHYKKNDYVCSYIATTKAEALSKEEELLKIYYDYCVNEISDLNKNFKDSKKSLDNDLKNNLNDAKSNYQRALQEAKEEYESEIQEIKEQYNIDLNELEDDLKSEIDEYQKHFDEPFIKHLIREKKLNRIV